MRFSLRTRVLAATLLLVALGLGVAGFATYGLLRKSLIDRVDDQLDAAQDPAFHGLRELQEDGSASGDQGPGPAPPAGTYVVALDPAGDPVQLNGNPLAYTFGYLTGGPASPDLPPGLPGSARATNESQRTFTAGPAGSGPHFRVLAVNLRSINPLNSPGTLVVAIPLTELQQTLNKLVLVEAGVAGAVLVVIGLVSWWLVRLGLRPLDRMASTAGAIAGGDLSQRVEPEDERTEVGRLGTALNTMLGQIEASFDEQRATEERLRRFVADASHELRTPLTSIRGYAELFRRGAAEHPADLERAMRRIESEGARMGLLVDDLLLLARLDQGRPLDSEPVDLSRVVTEAVHDFGAADPNRSVSVDVADEVVVPGDDARLRQVVGNLFENVRTHTPPGTPVSVGLTTAADEAVLEVADRGPGLSESDAERVFDRFYRGDPSRSRGSGGTGLGLSIASAIVHAHGGSVDVHSAPGHGATFRVRLPLHPTAEHSGGGERSGAGPDETIMEEVRQPEPALPAQPVRRSP